MFYKNTQPGYVTAGGCVLGIGAVLLAMAEADASPVLQVVLALVALVGILFSSLTTEVDEEGLRFWFGPGFWRKSINTDAIDDVRVVRYPWYYGWGIRYTPRGWLYSVSGLRGVEITRQKGDRLTIGTDDSEGLAAAIEEAANGLDQDSTPGHRVGH